jgi:hypothetical protein
MKTKSANYEVPSKYDENQGVRNEGAGGVI